jgi:ketosteroid isomerase-like protein
MPASIRIHRNLRNVAKLEGCLGQEKACEPAQRLPSGGTRKQGFGRRGSRMPRVTSTLVLATAIAVLGGHSVGAQQGTDIEGVKAANQAFYVAASARDLAQMDAVWAHAPHVRAIHPTSPRVDVGWDEVRTGWQNLFGRYIEISVMMPDPHVPVSDTMAWVTGEDRFQARRNSGEEVSVTLLGTSVFEKSGGTWLMVHHHVSVPPRPPQP